MKHVISKQIKRSNANVEEAIQRRKDDVVRICMKKVNESHEETLERRRKDTATKKNARTNETAQQILQRRKQNMQRIASYDEILQEKKKFLLFC